MKPSTNTLITIASAYLTASDARQESTVSHRVFGDTKKLAALRAGADITLGRFNAAMTWFASNWPEAAEMPDALRPYVCPQGYATPPKEDAA